MTTKQKILAALDYALDDIAEERLLDILLDAYAAEKRAIANLQSANAREREQLHLEIEAARADRARMRQDPLYSATGEYYFVSPGAPLTQGRKYMVLVEGQRVSLYERYNRTNLLLQSHHTQRVRQ